MRHLQQGKIILKGVQLKLVPYLYILTPQRPLPLFQLFSNLYSLHFLQHTTFQYKVSTIIFNNILDQLSIQDKMDDIHYQQIIGGQNFIQVGTWRFGMHDKDHFVFSNQSGFTSVIYRGFDGTVHPGPRKDYTLWNLPNAYTEIKVGQNYLQFGGVWRLTQTDKSHLSLSHLAMKTCMIWRVDGTTHPGPRTDFNGFSDCSNVAKIGVGQNFIEIGNWRIGATDNFHLSIGTKTVVSEIYRSDGTIHPGPRMDYTISKDVTSWLN